MISNINAYMIVMKDSEASNYYADYCLPQWKKYFNVEIYDAVTPKALYKNKELKFAEYSSNHKYISNNLKAEITDTEKACFYSHYHIWVESCLLQQPLLILEHDAYLMNPENLWYDDKHGIIFYDDAAMGAYIIQPWFAEKLIVFLIDHIISSGPYSIIQILSDKFKSDVVNKSHKKFKAASDQVMSKKYGNTIEHYCNLHPEHWPKEQFHKFIEIE